MNEQSNAPMSAKPAGIAGWFSTWMTAVTKPNEQTFATMAEHPDAMSVNRAFTWVFIAGTVSWLVSSIFGLILSTIGFASQAPSQQLGGASVGVTELVVVCVGAPVVGAISVLGFAVSVGIIQWVAKMFKGTGTFSQLAYTMAAVSVPFTLVSSVLTPFSSTPYINICTGLVSILLGLYAIVLEIMAVKGVNKFGWGEAAGSVFLPGIVLVCCLAVFSIALLTLLGPVIGNVFSSIQNSLP